MSGKEPKKDSEWVQHVKKYAEEHGISYAKALTASKPSYVKPDLVPKLVSAPGRPKTQKQNKQSHPDKKTRKTPKKAEVSPPPPPVVLVETHEPDLLSIARIIKNKVCKGKLDTTQNNLREAQNTHTKQIKECEDILYGDFVKNYFKGLETNNLTHEGLLNGLQRFYKDSKKSNLDNILTMDDFIHLFSQKTMVSGANYKRQHIFEALCRLLLLFNYDRNMFGTHKEFYTSLEEFSVKPTTTSPKEILKTPVNVSSKAGIVDIFFRTDNVAIKDPAQLPVEDDTSATTNEWACECINTISKPKTPSKKYNYIMIQNKYYEVEKSNISHYDVTRIHTLSSKYQEHDKIFDDGEAKIVLMVNNEDAVSSNLMRAKQQYQGLLAEGDKGIIGVKRLNEWFENILFDLLETDNFEDFKKRVGIKAAATKPLLQTRFHQKFIIDCTEQYIQGDVSKFIWGAVPRSGKSYMIGGLISKRWTNPENQKNDIVIILGAKTETESQFVKMFDDHEDFSHYNIFIGSDDKPGRQRKQDPEKPTIYLFSQEYLKMKCVWPGGDDPESLTLSNFNEGTPAGARLKSRFENKHIDLYFDEIHKGGSTDNSQSVIYTFKNNNVTINIFVMVTATFAKPLSKYRDLNFIGKNDAKPDIEKIEWSYNDQQYMKKITDATKLAMFVNTRTDLQKKVLEETFEHYRKYGGASYLTELSGEYAKYPELVLLSPQSIEIEVANPSVKITEISTKDIRNVFIGNLDCAACTSGKPVAFYKNYGNVFHNIQPVNNVLDFIGGKIRNYMKNTVKYPIDSPHTELWFLPDKNLYQPDSDCKSKGCKPVDVEEQVEAGGDNESNTKTGIANIEPLTRGLAFMLTENSAFKHYNVFIVHNTPFHYLGTGITSDTLFGDKKRIDVYDNKKKVGLSDQIKAFERQSYKDRKSVIILTGAKLRLGISLPCADIAFNFDDIKSIDANYQTMFRVLTEREKPEIKKYGYYFDFNMERSIQFLYEYNKTYGESKKKANIDENLEELQSLLFTFNYNGLNIIQRATASEVDLYNKLITELKLNEEGYKEYWSKKENIVSQLKRVLDISENKELVKELYKVLKMSKAVDAKKGVETTVLKKGANRQDMPKQVIRKGDDEDDGDGDEASQTGQADEAEEDYGDVVNHIAENLPNIIALLAMFSVDTNCVDVSGCLQHSIDNIVKGASRCTCENIMNSVNSVDILDCFFNSGKLSEGEGDDDDDDDGDDGAFGGGGKGAAAAAAAAAGRKKPLSDITILSNRIRELRADRKPGEKKKQELEAAEKELDEMKKAKSRNYTTRELSHILKLLLEIITDSKNEELTSTINNIFDTIRKAVNTMPKNGKHGLIYGMTPDDIEQKIVSYLSVRKEEKDKFGEVFTPMDLIQEMFKKLPKEVWSDPDKKWLDPANGIGNFPMVAYILLMEGLKDIPRLSNPEKRSNHIIENMLYMVEINPKNVKISRRIFGSNANICCADFLNEQDKVMKYFNERRKVEMFDVIIGNPPFQDEIDVTNSAAFHGPRKGGKNKLYERITVSCIGLLNPNGYLIFVTPDNIMTGNTNKAYEELIKHHTIYVCFNNIQKRYFPTVGQPMCYFLIQRSASAEAHTRKETKIESDDGIFSVELKERPLNPIKEWTKETEQLVNRYITDDKNNTVYNRGTSASQYKAAGKYSVIYTPTGPLLKTDNVELANGIGIKKVVLFETKPLSDGKLDATGEYGVGPHTFYVPFNTAKEGKVLDTFFKSDIYKKLVKISTTSQYLKTSLLTHLNLSNITASITASTKIQSVVRGHRQRQTARKIRKEKTEKKAPSSGGGGRSRSRRRHTRKKGIFGFF